MATNPFMGLLPLIGDGQPPMHASVKIMCVLFFRAHRAVLGHLLFAHVLFVEHVAHARAAAAEGRKAFRAMVLALWAALADVKRRIIDRAALV